MTTRSALPSPEAVAEALRALGAEFGPRSRVRHVTQVEGKPGIVTGFAIHDGGRLLYLVAWSPCSETWHRGFELELAEEDRWVDP